MPDLPPFVVRTLLGLVLGIALGFVARRGRFCTLGAIEDAVYACDTRRLRAWGLAIAIAIAGVHGLEAFGQLDLSRSIYTSPRIEWGGAILGGLVFGVGMALVGTCGFGTLLRLGGGDLKALMIFLVMALTAMATMRGVAGLLRVRSIEPLSYEVAGSSQRVPDLLGLAGTTLRLSPYILAIAIGGLALTGGFIRQRRPLLVGAAIGLIVVLGWWATGSAGFDPFDTRRVESFSFVAPLGEAVLYLMLTTALRPDFPVGAVFGVIVGAFLATITTGQFRWEAPDDAREMLRHLLGAVLMGFGGIAALGCTVGQGISGVSTLAIGSFVALVSIVIGARFGLYLMVER